jgi:adenylate cyclase
MQRDRRLFGLIPANPRCKFCYAPFEGIGGPLMQLMGKRRSPMNPNFCNICETFARTHPGGAEVELTMLFADVRGSTPLAERMSPSAFSQLMDRFYRAAYRVLVDTDGFFDKMVGDEVIIWYIPGFAGPDHARLAVQAAHELLHATGHSNPEGPWLPVGVGVHTGVAFLGTVGESGGEHIEFAALGDNVNITARLASKAAAGEILVSDAAYAAAGLNLENVEQRQLELKGKAETVGVHVLQVSAG